MKDWRRVKAGKKIVLGRYVVADPKVCGGRLTFRGTRVLVEDVLEQVAEGVLWESISKSWGWTVWIDAIEEALRLAREALLAYWLPGKKGDINALDEDGEPLFYRWWQQVKTDRKIELGEYVVAVPNICHGKLTFRGTRIFVADVLEQVARGEDPESIHEAWDGSVSREAVAEAVRLARAALLEHGAEMEIKDAEPDARVGRKHGRALPGQPTALANSGSENWQGPRTERNER